ncbi:MAG: OstA family protein [Chloroflexaceae bacterium]|nr:OstA family protein [Chloroflexaceae bacterium]
MPAISRLFQRCASGVVLGSALFCPLWLAATSPQVSAQAPVANQPLTVRSDIQEANSETGVITARGNVQIYYPARQLQATSAQAQYFSRERRLVLTGDVYVLQRGNSMRAETMTYLLDEGRFIATPQRDRQVESIYLVEDSNTAPPATP